MKNEGNKLAPSAFVWHQYCAKRGWALSQLVADFGDTLKLKPGVSFVGWCESIRAPFRPRHEGFVVMVEIEGEFTWFHANKI